MTDRDAALAANQAFYDAFNQMDMDAMADIWSQRSEDTCIHPGWELLRGWPAIRNAWRVIFANTDYNRIGLTDLTIEVIGAVARVQCVENLYTVVGDQTIHSQVAATNILVRTTIGWKITLHHGSPIASETVEMEISTVSDLDIN
ncbi:MAG: nuclear transport factor 2 family protein [Myxococcota bacterium]